MRNRVPQRDVARWRFRLLSSVAIYAIAINPLAPFAAFAAPAVMSNTNDGNTTTPIKHVIVIIGENRTFDHLFATYKPVNSGEKVLNLLSEGIVQANGFPGPNYAAATQWQAQDTTTYQISPNVKYPYTTLPPPLAGGGYTQTIGGQTFDGQPPFLNVPQAMSIENGLPINYYPFLITGGVTATLGQPDTRIVYAGRLVNNLPPGPYQITPGLYNAYLESPVHRFYQMWQQLDCSAPAGSEVCGSDLFAWVEATVGAGSNGKPPSSNSGFTKRGYVEGATALGFWNVQQGDVPYLKQLADTYSMSDNYHQAVNGGTGANHIMLGTGDAIWFSDGAGDPAIPPHNQLVAPGTANAGIVDEIEDPDPLPSTNNWYTQDGYGGGSYGSPSYGGGSYTDCADSSQPGVPAILSYLSALHVSPNCQTGHYYLLNNYNPGYYGDGTNAYADSMTAANADLKTVFTVPPSSVPNIGDDLLAHNISFAYFGDQFYAYLQAPLENYVAANNTYCNICNFFQYSTSIMTNPPVRNAALKDTTDLYNDLQNGNLPAVSFVKPDGYLDGHPSSSKVNLLEGFVKKIIDLTQANPTLSANTAIFITMDEGGGYYDSGYVQALDYFGDGTRIPMIVVSKYSTGGHISHTYTDHVSVLKFIEANWNVPPVSGRSRDNLPNPVTGADPYVPTNQPAIGNLMDLFNFGP
ncbi:MAG: phosphoesterase [Alphaproteobacteria bacterium]|nr:phosphoesterase [Alphaproteobacteria bacterium]